MMVIQHNKIIKKGKQLKKLNLPNSYHLKKQAALTKDSNEMEEEGAPWQVDRRLGGGSQVLPLAKTHYEPIH